MRSQQSATRVVPSFDRCLTGFFKGSHRVVTVKRYGMEKHFDPYCIYTMYMYVSMFMTL